MLQERVDQTDLEGRHEHDLGLPGAGEEVCAGHGASLLMKVSTPVAAYPGRGSREPVTWPWGTDRSDWRFGHVPPRWR